MPMQCLFCMETLSLTSQVNEATHCPRCQATVVFVRGLSTVRDVVASIMFGPECTLEQSNRLEIRLHLDAGVIVDGDSNQIHDVHLATAWDPAEWLDIEQVASILDVNSHRVQQRITTGDFGLVGECDDDQANVCLAAFTRPGDNGEARWQIRRRAVFNPRQGTTS